jgi:hypothetical protein
MTATAYGKGVKAACIDGGIRDTKQILEKPFPVYYKYRIPNGSLGRCLITHYQIPIKVGDVVVKPGDVIFADCDGVVCVPRDIAYEVLLRAEEIPRRTRRKSSAGRQRRDRQENNRQGRLFLMRPDLGLFIPPDPSISRLRGHRFVKPKVRCPRCCASNVEHTLGVVRDARCIMAGERGMTRRVVWARPVRCCTTPDDTSSSKSLGRFKIQSRSITRARRAIIREHAAEDLPADERNLVHGNRALHKPAHGAGCGFRAGCAVRHLLRDADKLDTFPRHGTGDRRWLARTQPEIAWGLQSKGRRPPMWSKRSGKAHSSLCLDRHAR